MNTFTQQRHSPTALLAVTSQDGWSSMAAFPIWRRVTTGSPYADDDVIHFQNHGQLYHSTNLDQLCDVDRSCYTYLNRRLDVTYLKNMSNVRMMKHQMVQGRCINSGAM